MDFFIVAVSRYNRKKYDQAIELCDKMLEVNPKDQVRTFSRLALFYLGCMNSQMQFIDQKKLY